MAFIFCITTSLCALTVLSVMPSSSATCLFNRPETTSLMTVMYAKAPHTVIQRAMHIHPTVAECLPTVLSKLEPFAGFDELTRASQKEIMTARQR
jgi:hypothetical protein